MSTSNCELPEAFVIDENSLPEEINPWADFVLNWSNCDNETNFRLYYSIYANEGPSAESLIILDSDTNVFTFTSDMLNLPDAEDLNIRLSAINGPAITPDSEGNFTGDGNGYFYGEYSPGSIYINYENSREGDPNQVLRSNREPELKEKEYELLKIVKAFNFFPDYMIFQFKVLKTAKINDLKYWVSGFVF